jgi:hypothetical protein
MAKTEDVFAKLAELEKLRRLGIRALLKEGRAIDRRLVKLGYAGVTSTPRKSGRRKCRICGKTGHNARTCPLKGKKT